MSIRLPEMIGKFRIEQFLWSDLVVDVYRAVDTELGRAVAFKRLAEPHARDPRFRNRFLREAKIGENLKHANIVRTFEYGERAGQLFVVTQLLDGKLLSSCIKSDNLGDFHERGRIALDIARVFQYLHGQRIFHLNVAPDRFHRDGKTGNIRLVDFGIVQEEINPSPYYVALEQLTGETFGPLTDVYAFGLLLFEIVTGAPPCVARASAQIDYEPLRQCAAPLPLRVIVEDATRLDPGRRPRGFGPLVHRLELWLASEVPTRAVTLNPRRQPLEFGHVAALALLAAIVGGLGLGLLGVSVARTRLPERSTKRVSLLRQDEMVAIPGRNYGQEPGLGATFLESFEIDRTEVTNRQYAAFCKEWNRSLPAGFQSDRPEWPVTRVTMDDARAYCAAQSKHVPTDWQWLRAARGPRGARFPWGENADATRANVESVIGHLVPADSMESGASAEGVLHLIGNAAEWVDQRRSPSVLALRVLRGTVSPPATLDEPWYIIKGGSFRRSLAEAAADLWLPVPGRYAADDVGFRCAR
jgi:serine/threonine protein kinase